MVMATPRMGNESPALQTALAMLARGLWPVAIHALTDRVRNPGKQPIGEGWGLTRPTEESLRATWAAHPNAGVGLKLGADGGVIDIEVDDRAAGSETLETLLGGEDIETMGWESRLGGHRLFLFDPRLAKYGKTRPKFGGLEVRIGTLDPEQPSQLQSVIPPTPNVDGSPRVWNGHETIASLPESVFTHLDGLFPAPVEPVRPTIPIYATGDARWSAEARARAYLEAIEPAVSGQRGHDRTFRAACRVGPGFDLPPDVARALIAEWNEGCQPRWSDKEIDHKIADAYKVEARRGFLLNEGGGATEATRATQGPKEASAPPYVANVASVAGPPACEENGAHPPYVANVAYVAGPSPGNDPPSAPPYVANVAYVAGPPDGEEIPVPARTWPDPPGPDAWHGPAGALTREVDPFTEADPVAVLVQFLVGFGNLIGRRAYWQAGATRHYLNLFACTCGPTSSGRKGTAWDVARMALSYLDPQWGLDCLKGGMSSGEGLIWEVRDPIFKKEAVREKKHIVGYQDVMVDGGIADKRLMVVETEMGGTLKVLCREGNSLDAVIRQAWDNGNLRTLTKNNPARATDAHISIVGHITEGEARKLLTENHATNGFANRFLWLAVRRSKSLPRGAVIPPEVVAPILDPIRPTCQCLREVDVFLDRDPAAERIWEEFYEAPSRMGMLGALTGRGVPMAMRLACIYALLDSKQIVEPVHLRAAIELWRFSERSAAYIFGESMGDRDADRLLEVLRDSPDGLTQTQIVHDVFLRHRTQHQVAAILGRLVEAALVHPVKEPSGGRPVTRWFATHPATKAT